MSTDERFADDGWQLMLTAKAISLAEGADFITGQHLFHALTLHFAALVEQALRAVPLPDEQVARYPGFTFNRLDSLGLPPGAIPLDLLEQRGVRLPIASGSEQEDRRLFREQSHLARWVGRGPRVCHDSRFPGKADPAGRSRAARSSTLKPNSSPPARVQLAAQQRSLT